METIKAVEKYVAKYLFTSNTFSGLKPQQVEVISAILRQEDVFVFLPTGFGKTLCFWAPPIYLREMGHVASSAVIVSPLLSLVEQQQQRLKGNGFPVAVFSSERGCPLKEAEENWPLFFYLTPEQSCKEEVLAFFKENRKRIAFLVIDECHCIAQSTELFRPEYARLAVLREAIGKPVLALTATPTQEVRQILAPQLASRDQRVIEGNLDRPEIFLELEEVRSSSRLEDDLVQEISETPGATFIFIQNKRKIMDLWECLKGRIPNLEVFHSDLTPNLKEEILLRLMSLKGEERLCVIATSALGMGLDIPNVRLVVFAGALPKSELDLAQMVGRACRDRRRGKVKILIPSNSNDKKAVEAWETQEKEKINQPATPKKDRGKAKKKGGQSKEQDSPKPSNLDLFLFGEGCKRKKFLNLFSQDLKDKPTPCCSSCNQRWRFFESSLNEPKQPKRRRDGEDQELVLEKLLQWRREVREREKFFLPADALVKTSNLQHIAQFRWSSKEALPQLPARFVQEIFEIVSQ